MIFKIFNIKHVLLNMCLIKAKDKRKHLSKSTMSNVTKTEFCWTTDEIQLLLESVNQYKCKCEYEGINWESMHSEYERIQELLTESYPTAGLLLTTLYLSFVCKSKIFHRSFFFSCNCFI